MSPCQIPGKHTPHDLYDWDLQNPPVLTTANGQQVVIDGGKAGILTELDAQTGKLIWQRPVGGHDGHENDGLLTEHATPASHGLLPAHYCLEPSIYGGILTELASNGSTTFAAVNDLALAASPSGFTGSLASQFQAVENAVGEMVAVNQDTGAILFKTPMSAGSNAPVAVQYAAEHDHRLQARGDRQAP